MPFLERFSLRSPQTNEHGFWEKVTKAVTRYPLVSILLTSVPLVILTVFYFDIQTGLNNVNSFPDKSKTKETFLVFEEEFSVGEVTPAGVLSPAEIVVDANLADPEVQQAGLRLVQLLQGDPDFPIPPQPEFNAAGDLALLSLPFPSEPNSRLATERLTRIRDEYIPAAFEGVEAEVYVGGVTAEATDFYGIVDVYTPIVFAFVLGLSFILLMLVFRSIAIPIKAIIMNLLSVGATYGLLVLVFQKGSGSRPPGIPARRGDRRVDTPVPVHHPVRAFHGLSRVLAEPHP